jgi:hypothetical protein
MNDHEYLFHSGDLRGTIDDIRTKLVQDIGSLAPNQLIDAEEAVVCAHFVDKYSVDALQLKEEQVELIEPREIEVDRVDPHWGQHYRRKMLEFRFEIPFSGDPGLFRLQPSTYTMNPPRGRIEGQTLVAVFQRDDRNAEAIRGEFNSLISTVKQYVGWQKAQIDQWNQSLPESVRQQIVARRDKLVADKQLITGLGFKIRRRDELSRPHPVPVQRKAVAALPPAKPGAATRPDPVIDAAVYEEILDTLDGMSVVMERNPTAFAMVDEETLRTHFLVPLNSNFRGMASGETFNAAGKTDILIKHQDRILFIAECKFWKGPQSLTDAITQLLSYTTWRETKAAILLFSRKKDFSAVLAQIPQVFSQHPSFVRQETYAKATGFRFILRSPNDPQRHLTVTLLGFNVPVEA